MPNFFKRLVSYASRTPPLAASENPPPAKARALDLSDRSKQLGDSPRILILKLDHIGDFITALEAFQTLKSTWPAGKITLVCAAGNAGLAERLNLFEKIIPFEFFPPSNLVKHSEPPNIEKRVKEFAKLDLGNFDLAIDLRHDADTRPLLSCVKARYRAGYTSHFLDTPLDISLPEVESSARQNRSFIPLHAQTRLTLLAELVAITLKERPRLFIDRISADHGSGPPVPEKYIIFSLASGAPIRKWPIDRVASLCALLISDTDLKLVLIGGSQDAEDAKLITKNLPPNTFANFVGQLPVEELGSVIGRAALFIGYDTGTTHLAGYLGVSTLGIYAAVGDVNVWSAQGENVTLLHSEVPCSPCYLREIKECGFDRVCLTAISVEDVYQLALRLLQQNEIRTGSNNNA